MIRNRFFFGVFLLFGILVGGYKLEVFAQSKLLTPEENLWLKNRNNTIVVYPEKNYPPFSYQSTSGTPQGLSIDYMQLLADKIGATIQYLPARPLSQILEDVKSGKGDVITSLADTKERENTLLFTDSYINAPAVIVVRKDSNLGKSALLKDLSGKKVAIGDGYAVEAFVRQNYPRVVIENVTDDEIGLQQVVLGEVDAAVMDVVTLSYYLSKQALNSVKIVGNTGFEYKLAFAVPKNKEILQSILDKGLQQISTSDRQILTDKWITVSSIQEDQSLIAKAQESLGTPILYALFIIGFIGIIVSISRRRFPYRRINRKARIIEDLQDKVDELEESEEALMDEMSEIKELEKKISSKIEQINK